MKSMLPFWASGFPALGTAPISDRREEEEVLTLAPRFLDSRTEDLGKEMFVSFSFIFILRIIAIAV